LQGITGDGSQGTQGLQGLEGTVQGRQGTQGTSMQGIQGRQGPQGRQGATSDVRLKTNVRPFVDGIQVVQGINPVAFQWNGLMGLRDEGHDKIGIIANELEKVMPYAVWRRDDYLTEGGPISKVLHYELEPIVFSLVNSAKQLMEEIVDLKRRVVILETINN
jgi:hypothetical protein